MSSLTKQLVKPVVPDRYHPVVVRQYRKLIYFGISHYCPVCRSHLRKFLPFGVKPDEPRLNALCPICGALERHRLIWLFMCQKSNLFLSPKKKMLHIAPEGCLSSLFQKIRTIDYFTLDFDPCAMVQADLTRLCFPDKTFDSVLASHVLEHIIDDTKAMREIFRVLKNSGWAILIVPIGAKETYEDPSVVDPDERARIFRHPAHVRIYGEDYYDRLREAGFTVQRMNLAVQRNLSNAQKLGLSTAEEITFCTKNELLHFKDRMT